MTSLTMVDPKELMAQHPAALRDYARRVIVHGENLSPEEEGDKYRRMEEFLTTGGSFGLKDKEMVHLIFRGLLRR